MAQRLRNREVNALAFVQGFKGMDANEFAFTMKTISAPPKPRKLTLLLIWLNIAQP